MGKQLDRHTDWLCNRCGLSAAAGPADWDRADIGRRIRSRCQRRDTLSPGNKEPPSEETSQVIYLLTLAERFGAAKVMEMKLHRLRDVRSDYSLLKQHG